MQFKYITVRQLPQLLFLQLQRTKIRIQGAGTSKSTSVQAWLVCVFGRSYPLRVETLLIFKFLHTSIYSRKWYRKYATCTVRGGNYCTFCNASPCMYIIHVLIYGGSHKKSLKWAFFFFWQKKELVVIHHDIKHSIIPNA